MAKVSKRSAPDRLEVGWAQLAEGRWDAARTSFEEVLAVEKTPEALEGLSWAAWWLDDAEAVFGARERAYRLYRKSGNAVGAARTATWLAADQLDFRGAATVASGWLQRARRLLDPLELGPGHGWLAFHDGYIAHGAATPPGPESSPPSPRSSGGGSLSRTWRCSVSLSRGPRSWPARRRRKACTTSTRRRRRRWR